MAKFAQVMRIRGVDVNVHWSVLAISGLMLLNAIKQPAVSLVALLSYYAMLLVHESGHVFAAQRKGCHVSEVRLYPVWAITCFGTPWSRFDHCVIAWGGVVAQAIVAAPLIVFVSVFGYTRFEPLNAFLAILGFFSIGVAAFNLLPIPFLDGSIAWSIVPEWFRRCRSQRSNWRTRL